MHVQSNNGGCKLARHPHFKGCWVLINNHSSQQSPHMLNYWFMVWCPWYCLSFVFLVRITSPSDETFLQSSAHKLCGSMWTAMAVWGKEQFVLTLKCVALLLYLSPSVPFLSSSPPLPSPPFPLPLPLSGLNQVVPLGLTELNKR